MPYLLIVVAIVVIIVAIISKSSTKDDFESYDLKSRNYYNSIKKQLSSIEQQKLETQINQINYINNLVKRKNAEIATITRQAENEINQRVREAEKQIENRWNSSNKNFYMCIALHYQSFTLADAIKFDSNMLQRVRNDLNSKIGDLIKYSIKPLQDKIDSGKAIRADYSRIKQLHIIKQDYIAKRDRLNNQIDMKEKMVDEQNIRTRQKKLYIKNNCGQKGRVWAEKIESKHRN